ncbi:hypothetical protein [Pedobacter rhodius]|uniref:Secreted protein n=1 Tax=Pedobacter rhodius TaxID=3004098 RepID=A0ABT4KVG3_9SPHI|nr:hypothetical protein [Pedobacter sp. SJ11]MCZ4222918.1 hypothetical protein [Pedobacter sp. SJ11]
MNRKLFNIMMIALIVFCSILSERAKAKNSGTVSCEPGDGICTISTDGNGNTHIYPGRLVYTQDF